MERGYQNIVVHGQLQDNFFLNAKVFVNFLTFLSKIPKI
jgi:hypothetical protein